MNKEKGKTAFMFYFIDLFVLDTDHFLSPQMPKTPPIGGKPAMERKRRARINESMSQLKLFIMEDLVDHVSIHQLHTSIMHRT